VFSASRYDKGGDDAYVNCPLNKEQYEHFVTQLRAAERVAPHAFEEPRYFEGCLPIEVMADRGPQTLAFGPMKPVGLRDPRTGKRPYAVVQLRREDAEATAYNLVGFQTRMPQAEQRRVFGLIPGLENARYERYGSVHRNTFVNAPSVLDERLMLRALPGVHLAGQICGVEGYVESAASGLCLGIALAAELRGQPVPAPPPSSALGSLLGHLRRPNPDFQPSNVVFSMFPPYEDGSGREAPASDAGRSGPGATRGRRLGKRERHQALAERGLRALEPWLDAIGRPAPVAKTLPPTAADVAGESEQMRPMVPEVAPDAEAPSGVVPAPGAPAPEELRARGAGRP
jgi:methylenetetrahydrofolate--tRNA-(uracil-5-)-methyltransferase